MSCGFLARRGDTVAATEHVTFVPVIPNLTITEALPLGLIASLTIAFTACGVAKGTIVAYFALGARSVETLASYIPTVRTTNTRAGRIIKTGFT